MNRFYCVVCNKVKRVQHYPSNVVNVESDTPSLRKGSCNRHSHPSTRTAWKPANEVQADARFNRTNTATASAYKGVK